jgi:signal recognition particle subunit SEC65
MEEMREASKEFITVWPSYLDSEKTLPQGRRIQTEAACE